MTTYIEAGDGSTFSIDTNTVDVIGMRIKNSGGIYLEVDLGVTAVTEAVNVMSAWLAARVMPGEAQGAIEPPPTAPAKDGAERDLFVGARSAACAVGLSFTSASRIALAALAAYRKEPA